MQLIVSRRAPTRRLDPDAPTLMDEWRQRALSDSARPVSSLMDEWRDTLTPGFVARGRLVSLRRTAGQARTL